jgi:VWFA-related protein
MLRLKSVIGLLVIIISIPATPQNSDTLKTEKNLVLVDITVADRKGNPVTGLGLQNFHVFENGVEQQLLSFEHITRSSQPTPKIQRTGWTDNRAPGITTAASETACVVLLDALNTTPSEQQRAKKYLLEVLKELPKGKRFAIFLLGAQLSQLTWFTDDPAVLEAAVHRVGAEQHQLLDAPDQAKAIGYGIMPGKDGFSLQNSKVDALIKSFASERLSDAYERRVKLTLAALDAIGDIAAQLPGKKNLVWISSSFPLYVEQDIHLSSIASNDVTQREDSLLPGLRDPGNTMEFAGVRNYGEMVRKTSAHLAESRVAIYPVHIQGLSGDVDASESSSRYDSLRDKVGNIFESGTVERDRGFASMQALAEQTGGRATFNSNDIQGAIRSAADDTGDYYAISYTPKNRKRDNSFRNIEVKTDVKDAKLRYRRGYFAMAQPKQTPTISPIESALMQSDPVATGLELAASLRSNGDKSHILLALPPDELSFSALGNGARKAHLTVGYSILPDGDRQQTKRSTTPAELTLDPAQFERARISGALLVLEPQIPVGTGILRVAVIDTNSHRIGSVDLRYPPKPVTTPATDVATDISSRGQGTPYDGPILPETGTLSAGRYTSLYFGFSFRIPERTVLSKLLQHLPPKGVHALAGLSVRDNQEIGVIGVFAIDSSSGLAMDPTLAANDEITKAKSEGRIVRSGPSARLLGNVPSVALEVYSPNRHESSYSYYVQRGDYLLKLAATGESPNLLSRLNYSLQHMQFTDSSRPVISSSDELYEGPNIPSSRIDALLTRKLGATIAAPSDISSSSLSDPALGVRYVFPSGWSVTQRDVFGEYHRVDSTDAAALREQSLLRACSRTVLQMAAPNKVSSAALSLLIAEPSCLGVVFPETEGSSDELRILGNAEPMRAFASRLSLFSDFGDIRSVSRSEIGNQQFVIFRGVVSYFVAGETMKKRRDQVVYVTQRNGRLLLWFFTAENAADIAGLTEANLHFDDRETAKEN